MNTVRSIVIVVAMAAFSLALGQDWNKVIKLTPEERAKLNRAEEAESRGRALMAKNKVEEAITCFRQTIAIERTLRGFYSSGNYELAKALTAAGREEEALAAYKQAFLWDPKVGDLRTAGPLWGHLGPDYALLLAKHGRLDEAKAIYYWTMRTKTDSEGATEPYPFLVVFDGPDSGMDVWDLTKENLTAAALMLRAFARDEGSADFAKEAARLKPQWVAPLMWQAELPSPTGEYKFNEDLRAQALTMAKTDEEREWLGRFVALQQIDGSSLERYHAYKGLADEMAAIGVERRKTSVALEQSRQWLKQNHARVASGVMNVGG